LLWSSSDRSINASNAPEEEVLDEPLHPTNKEIMRIGLLLVLLTPPLIGGCQERSFPSAEDLASEDPVSSNVAAVAGGASLSQVIDSLQLDARTVRFQVDKSDREFHVYAGERLLKTYICVLGENPVGDKFHQGDRKTPEGTFTFRSKRVHNAWHKFIWVDYPNAESWRRYKERKAQGLIPAGKDIGGEIGIHGVPEGKDHWIDTGQDWTWGCIGLKNADVDEIYPYIRPERTVLVIVP
jgi:L,D-transpeptidase catalytic domain